MKKNAMKVVAMMSLLLVMVVGSVSGQTAALLSADIPFDFNVKDTKMPAGRYQIGRTSNPEILMLTNVKTKKSSLVITNGLGSIKRFDKPSIVFRRYGNQYFMAKVFSPVTASGRELPQSKAEKEAISGRYLAQQTTEPEMVQIFGQ